MEKGAACWESDGMAAMMGLVFSAGAEIFAIARIENPGDQL